MSKQGLAVGNGPMVDVRPLRECNRATGMCTQSSAEYNIDTDTVSFDLKLVTSLNRAGNGELARQILEGVVLHELTHGLHGKIIGVNEDKEAGFAFEEEAYTRAENLMRKGFITLIRKLARA